jgi:hypothetical protein
MTPVVTALRDLLRHAVATSRYYRDAANTGAVAARMSVRPRTTRPSVGTTSTASSS